MPLPKGLHGLRRTVLRAELLVEPSHGHDSRWRACCALEPGRDAVVGQLGVIADHGAIDLGLGDRAVGTHHHLDDHRKPILVLAQ